MMMEAMLLDTEKCKKCSFGFDASYDGNLYEMNSLEEQGPHQYVQGCKKGYLPAMGYPCPPKKKEFRAIQDFA